MEVKENGLDVAQIKQIREVIANCKDEICY